VVLYTVKQVLNYLKEAHLILIILDSSDHLYKGFVSLCSVNIQNSTTGINHIKIVTLNLKLVTLLIRHYHSVKCIMVKTLELVSLYGEMSDLLTFYVLEFLKKFELDVRVNSLWRPHKYKFWR